MQEITRLNDSLIMENVALESVAKEYGTPSYVYSKGAIVGNYRAYVEALGEQAGKICYAVKANSNLAVLQVLANEGAHFDIVSVGELERVIRAGGRAENIIFSGVGKTAQEMSYALKAGIACFNVESEAELHQLSKVASELALTANISLRVNPDVDANTHPYISTGLKENKFGITFEHATEIYLKANDLPSINIVGVDCHIGSQLTDTEPFLDAFERLLVLVDQLQEKGIQLEHIDIGGGLGVAYETEESPSISQYVNQVKSKLGSRKLSLIFEPGRSIVANAGLLLTEVLYLKPGEHKNFAIVDAAMNDNIRPSLYSAWQDLQPVKQASSDKEAKQWDIVGPICETGDFLAKNRTLALEQGDLLALMSSGAYGFVMASNYNTRGRAPEIMIDGDNMHLIRDRETFDDLVRGEHLIDSGEGE